jgi:hypothetical protein
MKIAVVILAGTRDECFWPSYRNCESGISHDLIVVHRDGLGLFNKIENKNGSIFFLNKIIDGKDIPHKAFGAYRYAFQQFQSYFDTFIFISDDVILKRDNWLLDIVSTLNSNEKLGFGGSQIFNEGKRYPHESHIRAPFWFAKTEALEKTKWEFESDHEGEMRIGDQITEAGYFGVQVGNKINLGYDALELDHITQLIEKKFSINTFPFDKFKNGENILELVEEQSIFSPYSHIGEQKLFEDLEPFDGLVYFPSLHIAKEHAALINKGNNTFTIR